MRPMHEANPLEAQAKNEGNSAESQIFGNSQKHSVLNERGLSGDQRFDSSGGRVHVCRFLDSDFSSCMWELV